MPRPSLEDSAKFYTSRQAANLLGVSRAQLIRRINRHVLPAPTETTKHKTRLFSQAWIDDAKATLRRAKM